MTGYRANNTSLVEVASNRWEHWQTTLEQIFPHGTRWPWLTAEDEPAAQDSCGALRVAVHEVRCQIRAARMARHFTAAMLQSWSMPDIADDAALAVSELVTNAVRHGLCRPTTPSCPARLLLFGSHRALLCVVTDPSSAPPLPREPDYAAETGRGLQVVAGLSKMWGWTPIRPSGKAVWAGFTSKQNAPRRQEIAPGPATPAERLLGRAVRHR